MADATFTFRVDEELKASFAEAAKAQDRSGAQLLRDFMRSVVSEQTDATAYEAWFRAEVEQAVREADDPNADFVTHEEVKARGAAQRAEWLKRAGG